MSVSPLPLRHWAERILFGHTLADKLWSPTHWVDDQPGRAIAIPLAPTRPVGLAFANDGSEPAPTSLDDPRARGQQLHAFANHELLALELMALALLRFIDAPSAFRRGLAHTLIEEQRHCQLYIDRMHTLGVEFGECPVGGFFWRVMSPMPNPLDFVAHMALTFEQANLDFARHYAERMRAVGDHTTALLLEQVWADEIGHVKFGLRWFERWRDRGPSLFEAHRQTLRAPISPRRARGLGFDRLGRRRSGFPPAYIDQLSSFEASRGRPPTIHWFDPTAELSLGVRGAYTPGAAVHTMTADLELLPAFLAAPHDVVLLRRAPSSGYRQRLAAAGFKLPECIEVPATSSPIDPGLVGHPQIADLRPWGWSPRTRASLGPLVERTQRAPPPASFDRHLHAKTTWLDLRATLRQQLDEPWLDDAQTQGEIVETEEAALAAIERLHRIGYRRIVLKAPWGSSGRNSERIDSTGPTGPQRRWLARILSIQGAVIIEPWLDGVCDVSIRITVNPKGVPSIDSIGRFLTDRRGQYLATVLGPLTRAVPTSIGRWLHGDGRDPKRLERVAGAVAAMVATRAAAYGYSGPIGIDGLIYRDLHASLRFRPLVEVNLRPTLGHVAHHLYRRLAPGCAGLWAIVRIADRPPQCTLDEAVLRAQRALPTVMAGTPRRLRQGVVPTTDPGTAKSVVTLLFVAEHHDHVRLALRSAFPAMADRLDLRTPKDPTPAFD